MTTTVSESVNEIDKLMIELTNALVSNRRFKSLCNAGLKRKERLVVLQHLSNALVVLSDSLRKPATTPPKKAVAWIFKGFRTAIALRICEVVSPQKDSLDLLLASLDKDYVSITDQERLRTFINRKFALRVPIESLQVLKPESESEAVALDRGSSGDDAKMPDLRILSKVVDFDQLVCSGSAFEDMFRDFKAALFPPPAEVIASLLPRHILKDPYGPQETSVVCIVEWHVLEYFRYEGIAVDDFDSIFTLNGDLDCAHATRLGEYLSRQWTTGKTLLTMVKSLLAKFLTGDKRQFMEGLLTASDKSLEMQLYPALKNAKEQAYIKISGSLEEIGEKLQQLAWLTATLRPHVEGQVTVSNIDFRVAPTVSSNPTETPVLFHLSLTNQDDVFVSDDQALGQCWTSVASESILAHGFSMLETSRPKGTIGLEAPFDIMASFSGVRYPILVKERIVFASSPSVLIPETKVGSDGIQWHFERSAHWIDQVIPTKSKMWDARLETLNVSSLTHSRAFLGYARNSEELLGTAEFEHVSAAESNVPRVSKVAFEALEKSFRISVDAHGRAVSADGTKWKFNRGETALVHALNQDVDERMRCAARNPALLYDQNSSTAFLVSELGVVMHLVTTHLRERSLLKRQRIPLAKLSGDGGQAAYLTIQKSRDAVVQFAEGLPQKYIDIVDSFLDIVEQRRLQTYSRTRYGGQSSPPIGLRGWDHADLQARRYEIWERELESPNAKSSPVWWDLFRSHEALVLFTRISKSPIRSSLTNHDNETFSCRAWDEIPKGKHLLLASIMQLQILSARTSQNPRKFAARHMLNDQLVWARPRESRLFDTPCRAGGSCNPIQTMINLDVRVDKKRDLPKGWEGGIGYHQHPGSLPSTGAVLFADEPSSFEGRRCWEKPRSPMHPTSKWNYPYIAVSFLVVILAYWNFRLIAFSAVLIGVAYVLK